jgi:hypothetical protein
MSRREYLEAPLCAVPSGAGAVPAAGPAMTG